MSRFPGHQAPEAILETNIAIIGAGAAGLTLAASLPDDLIVIESGSFKPDAELQFANRSHVSGCKTNPELVRIRAIGGATKQWSGRCAELDECDFEHRPWIADCGWPISKADLLPWYSRAWSSLGYDWRADEENVCTVAGPNNSAQFGLQPFHWWFAGGPHDRRLDFAYRYRALFSGNGRHLLYAADAVELITSGSRVDAVRIIDRGGKSRIVRARQFVLAAGCIDNIKLLLLKHRQMPAFLGKVDKWLGRGFMQHLRVNGGVVAQSPDAFRALQQHYNIFPVQDGGRREVGLAWDADYARKALLGNAAVFFNYEPQWSRIAPARAAAAVRRLAHRPVTLDRGLARVYTDVEQVVRHDSRVALHDTLGPHGLPRADVHWKISPTDYRTAEAVIGQTRRFLGAAGLGEIPIDGRVTDNFIEDSLLLDSNHPLGGTRMSNEPHDGVVDQECRVHGTENLWVAGGSVFPAGGHANPTLTIVALAHRLAERLKHSGSKTVVTGNAPARVLS